MDANDFDRLAKILARPGARRGLLQCLTALPLLGGLASFLDDGEDAEAKGRRKRRKKRHKHGKGRHRSKRKKKQKCKPKSHAKTCAGKCGLVKNNCKKTVDCGSCACDPPCDVCFICNEASGTCETDPNQQGDACGEPGQVCQANGDCACAADPDSCPSCTTCGGNGTCQGCSGCCDGDTCVPDCGDCRVCDEGQCAGCPACCDADGDCQPGNTDAACGSSGACDVCTGQEQCQNQTCVCVPDCAGKSCGDTDGCGGTCTACAPGQLCVGQTCVTGQGTCAAGDDFCDDTAKTCNGGGCQCRITTEGDTRCGGLAPGGGGLGTCGECSESSDCATLYPAVIGAFCMAGGTGCCNGTAPKGLCIAPCPS